MLRLHLACLVAVCCAGPAFGRHATGLCGTSRETAGERLFAHRQAVRARRPAAGTAPSPKAARPAAAPIPDSGNIAILDDSDGVVAWQNQFNLDLKTLTFTPDAGGVSYRYAVSDGGYDSTAAANAAPLAALDDDDSRQVSLPFAFPFFGARYSSVFVNSDGNLTFTAGDDASSDRSLGRMTSGPPRISPLFDDLNPAATAGGVRMFGDASRLVVSWVSVPEWVDTGTGAAQTFQVTLYPDGRIAFSYSGISAGNAVVGIAPGGLEGGTSLVDFRTDASASYPNAVAERFGDSLEIDIVTASQRFYQSHEDSYDYLVIYNNMDIGAGPSALSYESTVRSSGSGWGVEPRDYGAMYGSPSRLQSVLNMGRLSDYPSDPNALVPVRASVGDTPITTLAHEAGHLFLAFASVKDPNDPSAQPMLGFQQAHWGFGFNSEASLLEGERIVDNGASANPRFRTTDTVQWYAPLDQYLMGFRAPADVPPTFLVTGLPAAMTLWHPLRNYPMNGGRRDIAIDELVEAMGRRTPDYTVTQRRFRFGFILVTPQGTAPSADDLKKVETFRAQFETWFGQAATGNASADATIKRSLELSLFPAAGVIAGGETAAAVTVAAPLSTDLTVQLQAAHGYATVPASVRIRAGSTSAAFSVAGVRAGVEDLAATPSDAAWETAAAKVQVADASVLRLQAVSGDRQIATGAGALPDPIVVRLTDANNLLYAGVRITAAASAGGGVTPQVQATDAAGQATFRWTPGSAASNQLQLSLAAIPAVSLTVNSGSAVPVAASVMNAASFETDLAAGSLAAVKGARLSGDATGSADTPWPTTLSGVRILLGDTPLPLFYVSDSQVNFYVPEDAPQGAGVLTVVTPSGARASAAVTVKAFQPGIFSGAILHAGTGVSAVTTPVEAGDYIEIYCTGLGATRAVGAYRETVLVPTVFIGAAPLTPLYSGLVSGIPGLYQVNVQVPAGLAPGPQPVMLSVQLAHSNQVDIGVK